MFPVQFTCSNANPVKPARSKLFKVPHTPLCPPCRRENFSFTFAINHGRQVVGLLYSPILGRLFFYSFVFFSTFLSYLRFVLRRQHFLNLPSSLGVCASGCRYACVCACVCCEKRRKNINPNAKTNFADPPLGKKSGEEGGAEETLVASFLPLLFLLMIYVWHAIG